MTGSRKKVGFKVSSRTVRMLGRQNVSNQHVAIIELIKNAYDADSPSVTVRFTHASSAGGEISIEDAGTGMDEVALIDRWLMVGVDYKERQPVSPKGRVVTGAKGIGRFALDRLGNVGILETFQSPDLDGLQLVVDWHKYDDPGKSFESILHDMEVIPNIMRRQGTKITIKELRDRWTKADYEELYEDLTFLVPPVQSYDTGFSIDLWIDEYEELSGPVQPLVREAAEYELNSRLTSEGDVFHLLRHRSGEERSKTLPWHEVEEQPRLFGNAPACGPVQSTILFYLRDESGVRGLDYKLAELRRYLDTFRGIRLYRDGFHIKPYGSRGNDWLGLDARKQKSPEGVGQALGRWVVSNNQLIGTIVVSRSSNPGLEDKTSREGLIENEAFADLKTFVMSGLHFLELERQLRNKRVKQEGAAAAEESPDESFEGSVNAVVQTVEELVEAGNVQARTDLGNPPDSGDRVTSGQETIDVVSGHATEEVPSANSGTAQVLIDRTVITRLAQKVESLQNEADAKLEELQLLRALATVGIALATFAHEIQGNIQSVLDEADLLKEALNDLPDGARTEAEERLATAISSAERVDNWSSFVLERVKKSRRARQRVVFSELVQNVFKALEKSFEWRSIHCELTMPENLPAFWAFPIDLEAILINLITNSVKALEKVPLTKRKIWVTATYEGQRHVLNLRFADSGRGIDVDDLPEKQLGLSQVLEPFVTGKKNDGTGMGLAVVNRIVRDNRGTVEIMGRGLLGGAQFNISMPIRVVEE